MSMHIRDGGVWKEVKQPSVRDAGVWKPVKEAWVRDGGVWKKFYNSSVLALTPKNILAFAFGTTATAGIQLQAGGTARRNENGGYSTITGEWATEAVTGNDYEVYATLGTSSGVGSSTGTFGSWLSLDLTREWTISRAIDGTATRTLTLQIRRKADHTDTVTAAISLEASREPI